MKLDRNDLLKIREALHEDVGTGDVTSNLTVPASALAQAFIIAKEDGVFCGGEIARAVFKAMDGRLKVTLLAKDGEKVRKNRKVLKIEGGTRSILAAERTALNFMGRLSGIATRTAAFVQKTRKYGVEILDTRKTTPLWRRFEKYAVKTGGGKNLRMGLYDAVFVKENHRIHGDLSKLVKVSGNFEIEVRSMKELSQALKLRPKVILLDNLTPAETRKAVRLARKENPKIILESSGGITEANAAQFAAAGIDRMSVGALTHSVRCFDFSLLVSK